MEEKLKPQLLKAVEEIVEMDLTGKTLDESIEQIKKIELEHKDDLLAFLLMIVTSDYQKFSIKTMFGL